MNNLRGPVVVGMAGLADDAANVVAAIDLAAREAIRRHVALCLVYGRETLPSWTRTCEVLQRMLTRTSAMHPDLAVTTAVYPGTAADALLAAATTASLVVLAAQTGLDESDTIAGLVDTTMITRAPVIMVVPAARELSAQDVRLLTTPLEPARVRQAAIS